MVKNRKSVKLCIITMMMWLCVVLANAEPRHGEDKPRQFGPDAMFAWIADDLKLSDEQRAQYDRITAELKEVKKNMYVKKLEEFKSFIGLVNKSSVTDADIDAYDKACADNEIASQSEIAAKMSELYSILDQNQQKRFIEKMTPKMPDGKGKDHPKGKKPPKNPPRGKMPPKGKPDMRHGEGHRMPPPHAGNRHDMKHGDGHRMPPQDRFGNNGHKPQHDGYNHRDGGMHGGKRGRMMQQCNGRSPQSMLGNLVRELKLDKDQFEKYHNIKREMREKM
ncbi:MAG: Spy/CpxP family protein refolding chaperone, partial [Spirochaetales bacterium]|nr:Spy/CpxP family protein refolding chaperone [Spirochaetales bacterium]